MFRSYNASVFEGAPCLTATNSRRGELKRFSLFHISWSGIARGLKRKERIMIGFWTGDLIRDLICHRTFIKIGVGENNISKLQTIPIIDPPPSRGRQNHGSRKRVRMGAREQKVDASRMGSASVSVSLLTERGEGRLVKKRFNLNLPSFLPFPRGLIRVKDSSPARAPLLLSSP